MTKHRTTKRRRSQKGGFSLNPMNWFGSSQPEVPNAPSIWEKTKKMATGGIEQMETGIGSLGSSIGNTVSSTASSLNPFPTSSVPNTTAPITTVPNTNIPTTTGSVGGRRRKYGRRRKTMKGGKGGLGLTYYATPVSGLKVAEPTSWQFYANGTNQYSVKGGSRKHRGRRTRRNKNIKT